MAKTPQKRSYHHGNLRGALLETASHLIESEGVEQLSMRRLAADTGVSRTALYHHFTDKNELLCAIAEEGFGRWMRHADRFSAGDSADRQQLAEFVRGYLDFASAHPELYRLMFGRQIWGQGLATASLRSISRASFHQQLALIGRWLAAGLLKGNDPLRTSQVIWSALHGMANMMIDGIYRDQAPIEEICAEAVALFAVDEAVNEC